MKSKNKNWKIINIALRILAYPIVLALILFKYNAHAIINSICFLLYGGEWITYAKEDKVTMQDIYLKIKEKNGA